jgi:putative holliday junction resolvase
VILGIDPGGRRLGVAIADRDTRWARPLEVIDSRAIDPVTRIAELVSEHDVDLIVVGRPVSLSGGSGPAVGTQQEFVHALRAAVSIEVTEHDERLTTAEAERGLKGAGVKSATRKKVQDAVAAQVMLQAYLDSSS